MEQELKAKWLAALRSGQYTQDRQLMCTIMADGSKRFCCLGVLADVADLSGGTARTFYGNLQGIKYAAGFVFDTPEFMNDPSGYFNNDALKQLGLTPEQQSLLYQMNDGNGAFYPYGRSFAQIADWIEENVK